MVQWIEQLETQLSRLGELHDRLLAVIGRKQQALRTARPQDLIDCGKLEEDLVRQIGQAERRRQEISQLLTRSLKPDRSTAMTLSEIAEVAGEPARGKLLILQSQLRERIEAVRRENGLVRLASEGLMKHVQGLVQTVTRLVTSSSTYNRRGVVPQPAITAATFTVTG